MRLTTIAATSSSSGAALQAARANQATNLPGGPGRCTAAIDCTLANEAGRSVEINPTACENKTVYIRQAIPIAVGDRLRWTRNDRTQNIRNGQAFTLAAIDDQGQAEIAYPDGR
jgi:plastocyanin